MSAARPSTGSGQTGLVAAVDAIARRHGLAGELLVAKGGKVLLARGYGTVDPAGRVPHRPGQRWRLASITKQVTAAYVVEEVTREGGSLDQPLSDDFIKLFRLASIKGLTLRHLLTHHSGLPNPDTTPMSSGGVPSFYTRIEPDMAFCISKTAKPGSDFAYNNCDYILARPDWNDRSWPAGMTMAKPGQKGVPGFVAGQPEPKFELASYGAAGGLIGTARAVFDFDRKLMTGKLLPPAALTELWKPEGNGSYQALGQWVFPGTLKGCAKPKRIVQRDGEIGGVQTRNFIFPDDDLVVIVFTNRSPDDFRLGEVWEGKGFTYDLLSAAACP